MSLRPCLKCGELVQGASYCKAHQPVKANRSTPGRGSGTQIVRFRNAVLEAAGHRCQAVIEGARCTAVTSLEAHHVLGLRQGGTNDPSNGVVLCAEHHRAVERTQRLQKLRRH